MPCTTHFLTSPKDVPCEKVTHMRGLGRNGFGHGRYGHYGPHWHSGRYMQRFPGLHGLSHSTWESLRHRKHPTLWAKAPPVQTMSHKTKHKPQSPGPGGYGAGGYGQGDTYGARPHPKRPLQPGMAQGGIEVSLESHFVA